MNPEPVPRLNLAPQLQRPLFLWNPLDYVLLLYWVFFFPQALRWYTDKYKNQPLLRLKIQGTILTVITPVGVCAVLQQLGIAIDWGLLRWSVVLGVFLGWVSQKASGAAWGIVFGVTGGVVLGITDSLPLVVALVVALIVAGAMATTVTRDMAGGVGWGDDTTVGILCVIGGMVLGTLWGATWGAAWGGTWGIVLSVVGGATGCLVGFFAGVPIGIIVWSVAIRRPENWLIGLGFNLPLLRKKGKIFSRVTCISIPSLSSLLKQWLRQDWETAIDNLNQVLAYTLQFIPVVDAVNQALGEIPPEQLIYRVSQLAKDPFDWKLLKFSSADLYHKADELRLDLPYRATAAGFWYLHEKQPDKATETFSVVRSLLYGEEMYTLANTLTGWQPAEDAEAIITLSLSPIPPEPQLRPNTWNTIKTLNRVIEDTKLVKLGISKTAKSYALNRAIGELRTLIDENLTPLPPSLEGKGELEPSLLGKGENGTIPPLLLGEGVRGRGQILPQAEKDIILNIAQNWKLALERIALDLGKIAITKPVINPYIIGDPVTGKLFVGRDDILRQLQEYWITGKHLQSVVIYGHRRMGKTSILRNLTECSGAEVQVIYINMQRLGTLSQGIGEIFIAICDEISTTLNISPPDDDKLLQLPERTFERYLKTVQHHLGEKGLIIAIDEFEIIEELIEAGQIPPSFMGYLRGLVQMSPKLAFIFAGLHTLQEMTTEYFQPFFGSVNSIPVTFLSYSATRQILGNPDEDFFLDYTPDALELIYELTNGQPYLVQLIGFYLVRHYNDEVFERGKTHDPQFTRKDVEDIINPQFFQQGRYYFEGVWKQANQGAPEQQTIIKVLAPDPEGLTLEELISKTNLTSAVLHPALDTLKRHDVIEEKGNHYQISVELFRQFVVTL